MILCDSQLAWWGNEGGISPFTVSNVNPASVDLCLAPKVINLETGDTSNVDGMILRPGMAILACTLEVVTIPDDCVGHIYLKSSMARKGLDHALAGLCDPGFSGQITLELHAHRPFLLTAGMRIVQIELTRMEHKPVKTYAQTGRYQGQRGPTEAKS